MLEVHGSVHRMLGSQVLGSQVLGKLPYAHFPSLPDHCRDEHYGFQLYQSDPSGNYGGWKAVAIGGGHQAAQNLLKTEYKDDITMADAVPLIIKVMNYLMTIQALSRP
jgi:hypothetical protein